MSTTYLNGLRHTCVREVRARRSVPISSPCATLLTPLCAIWCLAHSLTPAIRSTAGTHSLRDCCSHALETSFSSSSSITVRSLHRKQLRTGAACEGSIALLV